MIYTDIPYLLNNKSSIHEKSRQSKNYRDFSAENAGKLLSPYSCLLR